MLTEHAKFDPQIVDKIWRHLNANKTVVITTGLLKALQGKGIEKVVEVEYTGRNIVTNKFTFRRIMDEEPANCSRYPLLLRVKGLEKGRFYILTTPQNETQSYQPGPTRYKIVVKKPGARLSDLTTGAQVRGYTDGETSVFEVLQAPRTYNAYRFE